jgi:ribosomal protein L11 methyltransferase
MDYLELKVDTGSEEQRDILLCRLLGSGFESFVEAENILLAYIPSHLYIKEKVEPILEEFQVTYQCSLIPKRNWNEEWEKHFDPILISDKCFIRAPFHPPMDGIQFEIIIEPKMSFGTAHHETTAMMIEMMMESEFTGRKVLDMGCGTGILAIFARKLGADHVVAVDNDEWCFQNSLENIGRNKTDMIRVLCGDVKIIDDTGYDIILANINRNVLLENLKDYSRLMACGELLLSGFYKEDVPVIIDKAEKNDFKFLTLKTKNNWVAIKFSK